MGKWCRAILAATGALVLTGCADQRAALDPAQVMAQLASGARLVSCREPCLAGWRQAQPQAAQLDAARRWPELAATVLRVGYEDDLSLYYLGRAAEGIGYPGAAASYYRQSVRLAGTPASCRSLSRLCGGVVLPRAAGVRLAAIERELGASRGRRAGPSRPAAPASETAAPPANTAEAPPTAAPAQPAAPAPPPASPTASEFIEPPPAAR